MAADDIIIKLSFQLANLEAANKAAEQLRKVGMIQQTSVRQTTAVVNGQQEQITHLDALGQTSRRVYGQQQADLRNIVTQIDSQGTTQTRISDITTQSGDRSVAAMNRQRRGLVGLRLAQHKAQRASWAFVMMSMSMLGVFFSMMSFTMLLRKGFDALVMPLMDLDSAIGKVAEGFMFNEMIGNTLEGTYGSITDVVNDKVVPAWINIKALTTEFGLAMLMLGATIFSDQKLIDNISESINQFSIAMQDPEIQVAIKSMILAFADLIPGIANSLPMFAAILENMAPLIPALSKLAFVAAVLMPVFSVLNAFFMFASKAIWAVAAASEFLAMRGITMAVAMTTLKSAMAGVASVLAGLSIPLWGWIAIIAAVISAVTYLAYKLGWLDGIIQKLRDSWESLSGLFGDREGIRLDTSVGGVSVPTSTNITQNVSIGAIAEEVDADRFIDRLTLSSFTTRGI